MSQKGLRIDSRLKEADGEANITENFNRVMRFQDENRLAYTETAEKTVEHVFHESMDGETCLDGFPAFAVGDTVTLKVDGEEHSLVAWDDEGWATLGDTWDDVDNGTGEHGWLLYRDGNDGSVWFYSLENHTVSWETVVIHKIDPKYLPDDMSGVISWNDLADKPFGEEMTTEVWVEETTERQSIEIPDLFTGDEYIVTVDGVPYICNAYSNVDGELSLGDSRLLGNGDMTNPIDVPFAVLSWVDMPLGNFGEVYYAEVYYSDENTHTIKIEEITGETVKKLDPKYLPVEVVYLHCDSETVAAKKAEDIHYDDYGRLKYTRGDALTNEEATELYTKWVGGEVRLLNIGQTGLDMGGGEYISELTCLERQAADSSGTSWMIYASAVTISKGVTRYMLA